MVSISLYESDLRPPAHHHSPDRKYQNYSCAARLERAALGTIIPNHDPYTVGDALQGDIFRAFPDFACANARPCVENATHHTRVYKSVAPWLKLPNINTDGLAFAIVVVRTLMHLAL
jgi:hypothetical protein